MRYRALALAFLISLAFGTISRAGIIYSNFGPGDTYATGSGALIAQLPSISFVSATDQFLSEVDFAAYLSSADVISNSVTISLSADESGHPGSSALAFTTFTGSLSTTPAILQWILNPTQQELLSGNTYWITLDAPANSAVWNFNDQMKAGDSRFVSGVWTTEPTDTQSAIQIIGTGASATPEPQSWVLLLGGSVALAAWRRRQSRGLSE
jgi:hypothetical protein